MFPRCAVGLLQFANGLDRLSAIYKAVKFGGGLMGRSYYHRELVIFVLGVIAGHITLILFLWLKKNEYITVAWIFMAAFGTMVSTAIGLTRFLRDNHALDDEILGVHPEISQTDPHVVPIEIDGARSLIFPYATSALEAARDATLKYWVEGDPKHPPLQKTVQSFIAERGVPLRQAAELANAIKPDGALRSDRLV